MTQKDQVPSFTTLGLITNEIIKVDEPDEEELIQEELGSQLLT